MCKTFTKSQGILYSSTLVSIATESRRYPFDVAAEGRSDRSIMDGYFVLRREGLRTRGVPEVARFLPRE